MSPECRKAWEAYRAKFHPALDHEEEREAFEAAWVARAEQDAKTIADLRAELDETQVELDALRIEIELSRGGDGLR